MIEMNGEKESGKPMLAEWHDDDDDDIYIYIYIYIHTQKTGKVYVCITWYALSIMCSKVYQSCLKTN